MREATRSPTPAPLARSPRESRADERTSAADAPKGIRGALEDKPRGVQATPAPVSLGTPPVSPNGHQARERGRENVSRPELISIITVGLEAYVNAATKTMVERELENMTDESINIYAQTPERVGLLAARVTERLRAADQTRGIKMTRELEDMQQTLINAEKTVEDERRIG